MSVGLIKKILQIAFIIILLIDAALLSSDVIELQEEMVDAYIEMQNSAADAIKEIYQKNL